MKIAPWRKTVVVTMTCYSIAYCHAKSYAITESEAHELARLTMLPAGRNLPDMRFNMETALKPGPFYWFSITARVPDDQSPLLGAFAVNKLTGDVWDIVSCKTLVNGDVLSARANIRHARHSSVHAAASHSQIAPCAP